MTTYYLETKNSLSDKLKGPIDPRNGFPTMHPEFIVEAASIEIARAFFETKFPKNVLAVYSE